jgi:hypothetical protein
MRPDLYAHQDFFSNSKSLELLAARDLAICDGLKQYFGAADLLTVLQKVRAVV